MNFSQTTCERSATGLFISLRIFLFYGKWLLLYRIMDEISDMFILYRAIHFSHELWKQVLFSLKAFCFVNAPCDRFFSLFRFYLIVFWKLLLFFCGITYCKITSVLSFELSNMHPKIEGKIPCFVQIWLLVWSIVFCAANLPYIR